MKQQIKFIVKFFHWFWKFILGASSFIIVLFLLISLFSIAGLVAKSPPQVPEDSALVLVPAGNIVENRSVIDPLAKLVKEMNNSNFPEETLLQDLLDVIHFASEDPRIKLMVIDPTHMKHVGLNQLLSISKAIDNFKSKSKLVIAFGDSFNQSQYLLASHADEIYLNPMGNIGLRGFGLYRLYARELLQKLGVNFHIFKAGTYKSALEPFIRNNMSKEAKEANKLWLGNLWNTYRKNIAKQRGLKANTINNYINNIAINLKKAGGNSGQMALQAGLIDGLKNNPEMKDYMIKLVGPSSNKFSYNHINSNDYAKTITASYTNSTAENDHIGIIVAQGNIVHGSKPNGMISSMNISKLINKAKNDPTVKGLVLRIDSGGGSAFASEIIRQELLLLQKNGKPVVVSMGSMAASGAYWVAADADKIFASPVTLTGSIGVFGAFPTFENTLAKSGIFSDGIGTTKLADSGAPFRPLSPDFKKALQMGVEDGYKQFLTIVANGRKMDKSKTNQLAEGRVWDGATAVKVGLVDKLGDLEDAIAEAAKLADITKYEAVYISSDLTPMQSFLQELGNQASHFLTKNIQMNIRYNLVNYVKNQFEFLMTKDPANIYAHCLLPQSFLFPSEFL